MKKIIAFIICATFIQFNAQAQFTNYSKYDNVETTASQVEELGSEEIKTYNYFINSGLNKEQALLYINAGRAHTNLQCAPATIIEYYFTNEITESDSIPDALGACDVTVVLINTTPKTIKEITLEFKFERYGSQIYDIKTGDKYCVLKFTDLKGRTKSEKYGDILNTIYQCWHYLDITDATNKKLFYNKLAESMKLNKVFIKYEDGTTSSKVAIFDKGYLNKDKLGKDGPLKPLIEHMDKYRESSKF